MVPVVWDLALRANSAKLQIGLASRAQPIVSLAPRVPQPVRAVTPLPFWMELLVPPAALLANGVGRRIGLVK